MGDVAVRFRGGEAIVVGSDRDEGLTVKEGLKGADDDSASEEIMSLVNQGVTTRRWS